MKMLDPLTHLTDGMNDGLSFPILNDVDPVGTVARLVDQGVPRPNRRRSCGLVVVGELTEGVERDLDSLTGESPKDGGTWRRQE